jgi:2-dehydro-3-deoxyphosphogluconate aldolase/(4S)-4-hydroxy-2-oxoglutarate aldolase
MTGNDWKTALSTARVLPILAVKDVETTIALVDDLVAAGIDAIEILFRNEAAPTALRACRDRHPQLLLAAGTILSVAARDAAIAAGADCLIAPGLTPELAAMCRDGPLPLVPGAQTASEVMAALTAGFDVLKFYPAEPNGAPDILRDYANVFPEASFVPTGGITEGVLARYAALTNVVAVGGSWLQAGLMPGPDRATALGWRVARARSLMSAG